MFLKEYKMTDTKQITFEGISNLLDGNPQIEGGGKRAKTLADYLSNKYPEFLPYLDTNELLIFDEELTFYKFDSRRDKAMKVLQWTEVIEKIPQDVLQEYQDRVLDSHKIRITELRKAKAQKHRGYDLGAREFTLTYSPKWFSDEEARRQMKRAMERICKYYKDGDQRIIKLRAVGEVGTNGLSHVHCFYKLLGGVKITDKNFKRAYPPWDPKIKQGPSGHKGGHHASVRHESDFAGYIEKQVESAWLDISVGEE